MKTDRLTQLSEVEWRMDPSGIMRVPGVLFADETLLAEMDEKVAEQVAGVAALPGIVRASYAMPDAHWGYGFPIGGVAAFDADQGGVVSCGGVGFDISCGVRTLLTGLARAAVFAKRERLADALSREVPAGVGRTGFSLISAAFDGDTGWSFPQDDSSKKNGGPTSCASPS